MAQNPLEVPAENDVEICPVCSAVISLAGQQHLVWDRRIWSLYEGRETFETLDEDPVTRLPDGTPLRNAANKWLSVAEVRALYLDGPGGDLMELIETYGHKQPEKKDPQIEVETPVEPDTEPEEEIQEPPVDVPVDIPVEPPVSPEEPVETPVDTPVEDLPGNSDKKPRKPKG